MISTEVPREKEDRLTPLLDFIGKYESNNSYDVMYGMGNVQASSKTVGEIFTLQKDTKYSSSAIGKYQFIQSTLSELITKFNIPEDTLFDKELQDRLAKKLLNRRGLQRFLSGDMTPEQFIRRLSMEWASLPKDHNGKSYYAGDGLNKAHANYWDLLKIINKLR